MNNPPRALPTAAARPGLIRRLGRWGGYFLGVCDLITLAVVTIWLFEAVLHFLARVTHQFSTWPF